MSRRVCKLLYAKLSTKLPVCEINWQGAEYFKAQLNWNEAPSWEVMLAQTPSRHGKDTKNSSH